MIKRMMLATAAVLSCVPVVAHAQAVTPAGSTAVPSVAGYLCTFAGKCDGAAGDAATATRQAPATKGFRLARPMASTTPVAPIESRPANVARPLHADRSQAEAQSLGTHTRATVDPAGSTRLANRASLSTVLANPPVPMATSLGTGRPRANLLIGFERDSATLSAQGVASATVFAQSLLTPALSASRFVIEGHTDTVGSRSLNMSLSERRAQAVTDFLVGKGVDRSRLSARGVGPDAPLPGHSPADPDNRRVEAELAS